MYACVQIAQRARACHAGDSPRVRNSKVRIIWERATYIARVHAYICPPFQIDHDRGIHAVHAWRYGARGRIYYLERVPVNVNCRQIYLAARTRRSKREMASGSSSIDRRLFQQAYISPLEAVRDFFEALSELRAASSPSNNDTNNERYTCNLVWLEPLCAVCDLARGSCVAGTKMWEIYDACWRLKYQSLKPESSIHVHVKKEHPFWNKKIKFYNENWCLEWVSSALR